MWYHTNMNYKHGYAKSGAVDPLHNRWRDILKRCKNHPSYAGRGIKVCSEWLTDFMAFREWALSSGYKPHLTLDRIDNDGHYSPDNCRWVSPRLQARNRRTNRFITAKGRTQTIADWAEEAGISQSLIWQRINKLGWTEERAISEPTHKWTRRTHKTTSK